MDSTPLIDGISENSDVGECNEEDGDDNYEVDDDVIIPLYSTLNINATIIKYETFLVCPENLL